MYALSLIYIHTDTHCTVKPVENALHGIAYMTLFLHYYQDQLQSDTLKFEYDCYTLHLNVSRRALDMHMHTACAYKYDTE